MYRQTGSDELTRSGRDWLRQLMRPGAKARFAQLKKLGWRGFWQRAGFLFRLARVHGWNTLFDWRHRTDTAGGVSHWDLQMPEGSREGASWYTPVPPACLRDILNSLSLDYSEYRFFDLGAGKGKVLFTASSYPFKSVQGLELDHHLASICRSNLDRFGHGLSRECLIETDVMDWQPPEGAVFLFAYSPFSHAGLHAFFEALAAWRRASANQLVFCFVDDAGAESLLPEVVAHCEATGAWQELPTPEMSWDPSALFPVEAVVYRSLAGSPAC